MEMETERGLQFVRFGSPELETQLKQVARSGSQGSLHILLVGASAADQYYAAQSISRSLNCELYRLPLSDFMASGKISSGGSQSVLYLEGAGALFGEWSLLNPGEPRFDPALVQKIRAIPGHVLFSTALFDPLESTSRDLLDFIVEIPGG